MRETLWPLLEEHLFPFPSTDALFNPWRDVDPALDLREAAAIRRANLSRYLESFPGPPPVLLVGEAPGPHGCRFSGIPFTSEGQLVSGALPFRGQQSSIGRSPHSEYSAASIWPLLMPYFPRFLLWNCVPLHPHQPGIPLSIRNPKTSEVRQWADLLGKVVGALRPGLVVAVGRKAEQALALVDVPCVYLRHPSQGGLAAFREGLPRLLAPFAT